MFKKFSFFVDVSVRNALQENPALDQSVAYQRAIQMVAEFCRYGALMQQYRPPKWLDDPTEGHRMYMLMSPHNKKDHLYGPYVLDKFQRAYRVECSLTMLIGTNFRLQVAWFEKGQKQNIGYVLFTIHIESGRMYLGMIP